MDPSSFLIFAAIAQLPKNNFVSIGGGKSYLFSLFGLPSVLANTCSIYFLPSVFIDHSCCFTKSSAFLNPHFLNNSSSLNSLIASDFKTPVFSTITIFRAIILIYIVLYIGLNSLQLIIY